MQQGPLPTLSLIAAVICGVIAGARGKPGPVYGALAGGVIHVLGDILQMSPSATGGYFAAIAIVTGIAVVEGAIWGGIWGAVGGWLGRKIAGGPVSPSQLP